MTSPRTLHVLLTTPRLVLRRFTVADVDLLVDLDADPEVMRFITGGRATPRDVIEQRVLPDAIAEYDRHPGTGKWAAHDRNAGEFVGLFALRWQENTPADELELGYRLRRSAWGRGYATEGARALIRYAFTTLGASRVYAGTMTVNERSRRVMEVAGLRYVRTFHLSWDDPIAGVEHGEVEYELRSADWTPD